jgi:hypothetical protein
MDMPSERRKWYVQKLLDQKNAEREAIDKAK